METPKDVAICTFEALTWRAAQAIPFCVAAVPFWSIRGWGGSGGRMEMQPHASEGRRIGHVNGELRGTIGTGFSFGMFNIRIGT